MPEAATCPRHQISERAAILVAVRRFGDRTYGRFIEMLDRFEVRVSIQKLLIALLVVIVPLSAVGLYLTQRSDKALDKSIGTDYGTIADLYGSQVAEFVRGRVADIIGLASDPNVVSAVAAAGRTSGGTEEAANQKIDKLNKEWNTAQGEGAVKSVLYSPASEALRRHRDLEPHLLRLTATDERGNVVAATQKPAKYSYSDDTAWRAAYANGQGAASVGNILFDSLRKQYYVEFGVPIFDSGSSRFIGVMLAGVNMSDLISRFQQMQMAGGARALLVSDDGTIISGPKVDLFARLKSDEFDAIRESLGTLQGRQTGYVVANTNSGRRIIGFADAGLKEHFSNLGWIVLVSQDERIAAAPMRAVEQFAIAMVVLGILMVTLLGVYYYLHRSENLSDIEEVLESRSATAAAR